MDWLVILERYGIPLVVAVAFWIFIQKQNKFIQDELQKEYGTTDVDLRNGTINYPENGEADKKD